MRTRSGRVDDPVLLPPVAERHERRDGPIAIAASARCPVASTPSASRVVTMLAQDPAAVGVQHEQAHGVRPDVDRCDAPAVHGHGATSPGGASPPGGVPPTASTSTHGAGQDIGRSASATEAPIGLSPVARWCARWTCRHFTRRGIPPAVGAPSSGSAGSPSAVAQSDVALRGAFVLGLQRRLRSEPLVQLHHLATGLEPTDGGAQERAGEPERRRERRAVLEPRVDPHHGGQAMSAGVDDRGAPTCRTPELRGDDGDGAVIRRALHRSARSSLAAWSRWTASITCRRDRASGAGPRPGSSATCA
jgi:hypothetical protein